MKRTILIVSIIISTILLFSSCTNLKSKTQECHDMESYTLGVEEGGNQKRGSQVTGETFSCSQVRSNLHPNTNKECFCKGYRKGFNQ